MPKKRRSRDGQDRSQVLAQLDDLSRNRLPLHLVGHVFRSLPLADQNDKERFIIQRDVAMARQVPTTSTTRCGGRPIDTVAGE